MGEPVASRLDRQAFEASLSQYTTVSLRADQGFVGTVRTASHRGVHLSRVTAPGHVARGSASAEARDRLVFGHTVRGTVSLVQDGRTADIGPGDFFLYNPGRPYTLGFTSEYEIIGIVMPMRRLSAYTRTIDSMTATRIDSQTGMGAIASAIIDRVERGTSEVRPELRSRLIETVADAIDALCWQEVAASGLVPQAGVLRLQEALDHIEMNLGSPELSPVLLAAQLHISLRTLYGVFEHADLTVSAVIRSRRLERCAQDLRDPSHADETISEIAARWGFGSPTNFTRSFRQRFGCAPSAYRAAGPDVLVSRLELDSMKMNAASTMKIRRVPESDSRG